MGKNRSYANQISDAQVMLSGLKANVDALQSKGIDAAFIEAFETRINRGISENNEQEKLKADQKAKTASLDATLIEIGNDMSESTEAVKRVIPKDRWKEFGINAKR